MLLLASAVAPLAGRRQKVLPVSWALLLMALLAVPTSRGKIAIEVLAVALLVAVVAA